MEFYWLPPIGQEASDGWGTGSFGWAEVRSTWIGEAGGGQG
jgi:hypothetical protein